MFSLFKQDIPPGRAYAVAGPRKYVGFSR